MAGHLKTTAENMEDVHRDDRDYAPVYEGLSPLDNYGDIRGDRNTHMEEQECVVPCQKSLFNSQKTPPTNMTQEEQAKAALQVILSLKTCSNVAINGLHSPPVQPKKPRKRHGKKADHSASQTVPCEIAAHS
jgi:hypothetical protein